MGADDPIEEPSRPGTEKPEEGSGDNNSENNGNNEDSDKDDKGEKEDSIDAPTPKPVITFESVTVTDTTYSKATIVVRYKLENVKENPDNKIVCRLSSSLDDIDERYNGEVPISMSGTISYVAYCSPKRTYYVRFDAFVGDNIFKSDIVSFTTPAQPVVAVTGISLSQTSMKLKVGDKEPLYAFLTPSNVTNKGVKWLYYDTTIAQSYRGVITIPAMGDASTVVEALKPGTTKIVAETVDGGFTATCDVVVEE